MIIWRRDWITYRNGDVPVRLASPGCDGRWVRASPSHPAAICYRERLETCEWFYNEELYALRLMLGMVWDGTRVLVDEHDQVCGVIPPRPHLVQQGED